MKDPDEVLMKTEKAAPRKNSIIYLLKTSATAEKPKLQYVASNIRRKKEEDSRPITETCNCQTTFEFVEKMFDKF
jgi:hypothetical protein